MIRSAHATSTGSTLLGFGAAVPERRFSAADLGRPFDKDGPWIESRTGIRELGRVSGPAELQELARLAARDALLEAGLTAQDVDAVITASCSIGNGHVGSGGFVADVAPHSPHLHLNSACSGFCYALGTADGLIRSGDARHVLIIGAEQMSALIDPADLGTSIIFGDGAGAAVVGPAGDGPNGLGPTATGSDGAQASLIECIALPGGALSMAGRRVFRWAVERVPDLAREACRRAGVTVQDIEVFVPHQANLRIIDAVVQRLHLRGDAVIADSIVSTGNTSAASIPIAISRLREQGRTRTGSAGAARGLRRRAQLRRPGRAPALTPRLLHRSPVPPRPRPSGAPLC